MLLNGWRRLATVIGALWLIGAFTLTGYEWSAKADGFFAYLSLPPGTVVSGNEATLPDGRKVPLSYRIGGKELKPWDIKWDDEPEVPTVQRVNWRRLLLVALVLPVLAWLAIEGLVLATRWVVSGFGKDDALNDYIGSIYVIRN